MNKNNDRPKKLMKFIFNSFFYITFIPLYPKDKINIFLNWAGSGKFVENYDQEDVPSGTSEY
jgi:hypothetical protein